MPLTCSLSRMGVTPRGPRQQNLVTAQHEERRQCSLIRDLAKRLTQEFGRGYGVPNLKNFRQFYLAFPADVLGAIGYTLRSQFTWSRAGRPALRQDVTLV